MASTVNKPLQKTTTAAQVGNQVPISRKSKQIIKESDSPKYRQFESNSKDTSKKSKGKMSPVHNNKTQKVNETLIPSVSDSRNQYVFSNGAKPS